LFFIFHRKKLDPVPDRPVGTFFAALALSFDPKGTNVGSVSLVVGRGAGQLGQQFRLVRRQFPQGAGGTRASLNWNDKLFLGFKQKANVCFCFCFRSRSRQVLCQYFASSIPCWCLLSEGPRPLWARRRAPKGTNNDPFFTTFLDVPFGLPLGKITWMGSPYSRSRMHVWQTFLTLAHVWHTSVFLKRMRAPGHQRNMVKGLRTNCFASATFFFLFSETVLWFLPEANFALLAVPLLGHSQIGIVSEARLAQNGKLGVFPVHAIISVGSFGGRHPLKVIHVSKISSAVDTKKLQTRRAA